MQLSFNTAGDPASPSPATLVELQEGEQAVLDRLDLPEDVARRLMELGFVPGHVVAAGRSAPGGDPRVYRVDGSEIALRFETASHLRLRPLPARA
jgi:ferrous iron transport protein A